MNPYCDYCNELHPEWIDCHEAFDNKYKMGPLVNNPLEKMEPANKYIH